MKSLHALYVWRLAKELGEKLVGLSFADIFSLDKNHLCLNVWDKDNRQIQFSFKILGNESLIFEESEPRGANRKIQAQFDSVLNKPILAIEPHTGERSFQIQFKDARMVFFLHGRNAFVGVEHQRQIEVFPPDITSERYQQMLGSLITLEWEQIDSDASLRSKVFMKNLVEVWGEHPELDYKAFLQQFLSEKVYLNKTELGLELMAFPRGENLASFAHVSDALTEYARVYIGEWYFNSARKQLESRFLKDLSTVDKRLNALYGRLDEMHTKRMYRHWADLLLSNLTLIPTGASEVEVLDYLTHQSLTIPLQKQLSIQEDIERYYRKSKNQQQETQRLEQDIQANESKKEEITLVLKEIGEAKTIRELRSWLKEEKKAKVDTPRLPYHEFNVSGFVVMVGKQARDNDELTLKIAKKDDLWLHARDVSGSHVVIRKKAGLNFPDAVVEYAAGLALWFSKRKNESLAPVIVAEKKFVRKKKGAALGAVVVEKEKVIMVEPKAPPDK